MSAMHDPAFPSGLALARRLRLQQLAIFTKVIESGSVLAASRELAMTQPAISKSIQDLEQQLGVTLFERSKRGMALTDVGHQFEHHAKLMLSQLRYLSEDLASWKSGTAGHLIVGTLIAASATMLPNALGHLKRIAPNVSVTVKVGANATLYPMLLKGELDIVLGILPEDASVYLPDRKGLGALRHVPLYDEGLNVVVSAQHPLAQRRKPVTLDALHGLEWIVPTRDSATYRAVLTFFREKQLPVPEHVIESVSILTNLELIVKWNMVCIMPSSVARRFEELGLVKVLAFDHLSEATTMGYTIRSDREQSAIVQSFIQALRQSSVQE
ncbi:LysR family transcriptional regulator [Diaphorobacter caeni]|uniref:LysR family transcriptional regulator n=1 Tax=Diaphorobacter caeni TaxID=2784387 RepID=UPI00188FE0E0|nr:LysR family transcriptional regulator [Diaphorobacter caeni]MBF5006777.1 LysR family transcriptional regulator [Diaphorobacter caeni]